LQDVSRPAELVALLSALAAESYRFIAVTPATHERVLRNRGDGAQAGDLRDVFGWSMPFRAELLPSDMLEALRRAGAVEEAGGLLKSMVRVSSVGSQLFLHSAFPTVDEDAVFFGPDTYRFTALVRLEIGGDRHPRRLVEIGAGSGAAALIAGRRLPGTKITLLDINPKALRLASVNAAHAGVAAELVEGSNLDAVEGPIDLILANPPFIMDEAERAYRDGGGELGAGVSLDWALSGGKRLEPGGRMILYTGVAIIGGHDHFRARLEQQLPALGCTLRYRELDPDIFGEELDSAPYKHVERIAAVAAVIERS
jgi:precorrin-6B methylase 2